MGETRTKAFPPGQIKQAERTPVRDRLVRRLRFLRLCSPLTVVVAVAFLGGFGSSTQAEEPSRAEQAELRAVRYLTREVPLWSRENHCFSCHNNGDAARALMAARARGIPVADEALRETLAFLGKPESWDLNGVDAEFSDKDLARLQFANALATAIETGTLNQPAKLAQVARTLEAEQAADGSWDIDGRARIGSPATYGTPLGTALARRVLRASEPRTFREAMERSKAWLIAHPVRNNLDAASILIGLEPEEVPPKLRQTLLRMARDGQGSDGGWGPFTNAPSESFDTAIMLIGLSRWPDRAEVAPLIEKGRAYLVGNQEAEGNWSETTRPTGGISYAQRLSTSGWALLALLATR